MKERAEGGMTTDEVCEALDILEEARGYLAAGCWHRGTLWRGKSGDPVSHKRSARSCCAVGAIDLVGRGADAQQCALEALEAAAGIDVVYFNDDEDTTLRDVLFLFDVAIADLEEQT